MWAYMRQETMSINRKGDNVFTVQWTEAKKHIFSVQRTKLKENEMDNEIDMWLVIYLCWSIEQR